jgi:flagellar hook assembly protein FlgD
MFLRMALTPDWRGMAGAIGGGPVLVQDGKAVFRANELFAASVLNPRSPRSAVGQLADGRILLVTVDGALGGYSVGMTNFELALAMRRLGAVTAMALGSGTVTTMAFDGELLNRPAGRGEPDVSDALALLYTGVYAPPPSEAVFSPNGDGVADEEMLAYRLVRPSSVTASVIGGGTRLVLDSGRKGPGLQTFTFSGKRADGSALAEGSYRLVVSATDDGGQGSTAERGFALNNTLASLAVTPETALITPGSRGVLAVTFELSRPSDVRATIETRTGIVVRTLADRKLLEGSQKLLWDGRTASGRLAFDGSYLVRVRATNAIGRVELTEPFRARRG